MSQAKIVAGWCEWIALPEFRIAALRAKLDSGARTSALHVQSLERTVERGVPMAELIVGGVMARRAVRCPIVDERTVTDSGGHRERRVVIETTLVLGELRWPVELTVTRRDGLRFRMLIGRSALRDRLLVDPARTYLLGKPARGARRSMDKS